MFGPEMASGCRQPVLPARPNLPPTAWVYPARRNRGRSSVWRGSLLRVSTSPMRLRYEVWRDWCSEGARPAKEIRPAKADRESRARSARLSPSASLHYRTKTLPTSGATRGLPDEPGSPPLGADAFRWIAGRSKSADGRTAGQYKPRDRGRHETQRRSIDVSNHDPLLSPPV